MTFSKPSTHYPETHCFLMHSRTIQSRQPITAEAPPLPHHLDEPAAPRWIEDLVGGDAGGQTAAAQLGASALIRGDQWSWAQCREHDEGAKGEAFERVVASLYARLHALLRDGDAGEPVRFWNYIPRIHQAESPGCDRYMSFNAGRHRALEAWHRTSNIQPRIVAASAFGHAGSEIIVEALCGRLPSKPVENPRQRPAYCYSPRYGRVPPSFARASLIEPAGRPALLLTAGTASVVGEDSLHIDDVPGQLAEIELNLAALVAASTKSAPAPNVAAPPLREQLGSYRHLRAYVVRSADAPAVLRWMQSTFTGLESIELMQAELCRRDLLVEVEGVAVLAATA